LLSLGSGSRRRRRTLVLLALAAVSLGQLCAELLCTLVEDVGVVWGDVGERWALCVLVVLVEGGNGGGEWACCRNSGGCEGACPLCQTTGEHGGGSNGKRSVGERTIGVVCGEPMSTTICLLRGVLGANHSATAVGISSLGREPTGSSGCVVVACRRSVRVGELQRKTKVRSGDPSKSTLASKLMLAQGLAGEFLYVAWVQARESGLVCVWSFTLVELRRDGGTGTQVFHEYARDTRELGLSPQSPHRSPRPANRNAFGVLHGRLTSPNQCSSAQTCAVLGHVVSNQRHSRACAVPP
jgi:hypothetical protein